MSHLGERLTPFVDGELDHTARDKALAHVAGCDQCRADAEAERRIKALLAAGTDPSMPPALTARLFAIADAQAPPTHPASATYGGVLPGPTWRPGLGRPAGRDRDDHRPPNMPGSFAKATRRRAPRYVALTGSLFSVGGLAFGAAFLLGGSGDPAAPPLQPPVSTFSVQHVVTSNDMPLNDPAAGVVPASFRSGGAAGPNYGGFGSVPISSPMASIAPSVSTGAPRQ